MVACCETCKRCKMRVKRGALQAHLNEEHPEKKPLPR
jgi:hypothetical protein